MLSSRQGRPLRRRLVLHAGSGASWPSLQRATGTAHLLPLWDSPTRAAGLAAVRVGRSSRTGSPLELTSPSQAGLRWQRACCCSSKLRGASRVRQPEPPRRRRPRRPPLRTLLAAAAQVLLPRPIMLAIYAHQHMWAPASMRSCGTPPPAAVCGSAKRCYAPPRCAFPSCRPAPGGRGQRRG